MLSTVKFIYISALISFLLALVGLFLSFIYFQDREKGSPYECGFDPKGSARTPFSLRFFLLALIFLIFDIEVVLLFPIPFLTKGPLIWGTFMSLGLFISILFLGLLHEWNEGSLNWTD